MGLGHLADEVADVVVRGCADDLVGATHLDDLAVSHDQDPVAELQRLGEVVGDEDHRLADLLMQPDDLVLHVATDQRVQGGERLVEHQDLRVRCQCSRQPDALLHAAGELIGVVVLITGEADEVDHLLGPVAAFGLALTAHFEAEADVVDDLAVRQQPEVLEHHRDLVPAGLEQRLVVHRRDVLAVQRHRAGGGLDQPRQ